MKVYRGFDPNVVTLEKLLSGAAYPGQAVEISTSYFIASSVADSMVAILTDMTNIFDGSTLEGAYEDGDRVEGYIPREGDPIEMVLATSQTIVAGDKLKLNSSGYLAEASDGADTVGGATNYITFTPLNGQLVNVAFVDPSATSQSLSVTITGNYIKVLLATDGSGAITSTPALINAAIAAVTGYDSLVSMANTGTGAVEAGVAFLLADKVFATAEEAVTTTDSIDTIKAIVTRNTKA